MTTKRQHYVPQSYLKGFSTARGNLDKFVWVYDREFCNGKAPSTPKSVSSICYEDFYYAQRDEGGILIPDLLEDKFAEIESIIAPIIKNLSPNQEGIVALTEEERGQLAFFIGISLTRVPSFREGVKALYKEVVERTMQIVDMESAIGEEGSEFLKKHQNDIKVTIEEFVSLKPMIEVGQAISQSILDKSWQFYKAPLDRSFITCDNPVFYSCSSIDFSHSPYSIGPAHPLTEIIFPLRKDITLVCTPKTYGHKVLFKATSEEVKKINRGIVRSARKYIIADHRSDALARLVSKNKGAKLGILID